MLILGVCTQDVVHSMCRNIEAAKGGGAFLIVAITGIQCIARNEAGPYFQSASLGDAVVVQLLLEHGEEPKALDGVLVVEDVLLHGMLEPAGVDADVSGHARSLAPLFYLRHGDDDRKLDL